MIASPAFEILAVGGVSGGHKCSRAGSRAGSEKLVHVAPGGDRLVAAYAPSCTARRLFWFLTQPGIKNASTRTQITVINIPTIVSVKMSWATATPVRLR